jgi:arabinofuranan 3-O-arabinosyltransferase
MSERWFAALRAEGPNMSVADIVSPGMPNRALPDRLVVACFGLCVAHVVYLAASFAHGFWLIQADGQARPDDFVNVWAAGRLALDGQPALAYDWTVHKQAEDAAVGHSFPGYYAWPYPPTFLFIASLVALFPFLTAYAGWVALTFPLYAFTLRWIVGHPVGLLLAGAVPPVLANAITGQNGFITTALIGATLGFMEKRPVVAGLCLGLLTYKPHFGLLFPLVLIASRRWTVFFTAAATGLLLALAAWLAFGTSAWEAFLHSLPVASKAFLSEGEASFAKLQSLYGLVRMLGGSESLGWSLHLSLGAIIAIALCVLWRSNVAFDMKAAALALGAVLATPYAFTYDLVILGVPVAFMLRTALASGFRSGELPALAIVAGLLFSFPFVLAPVGLVATVILSALVARRCFCSLRQQPSYVV